jgi:hypothetical protein
MTNELHLLVRRDGRGFSDEEAPMKMLTFNETTGEFEKHEFVCARLSLSPPLPMCEKRCQVCFETDAKHEFDFGVRPDKKQ